MSIFLGKNDSFLFNIINNIKQTINSKEEYQEKIKKLDLWFNQKTKNNEDPFQSGENILFHCLDFGVYQEFGFEDKLWVNLYLLKYILGKNPQKIHIDDSVSLIDSLHHYILLTSNTVEDTFFHNLLEDLVQVGLNINCVSRGKPLLSHVIYDHEKLIFDWMLLHGVDVNPVLEGSLKYQSPLHTAIACNNFYMVTKLIEAGADVFQIRKRISSLKKIKAKKEVIDFLVSYIEKIKLLPIQNNQNLIQKKVL